MPKQVFKIERFENGILSHFEPRDVPEGGLVTARSCDLSTVGIVKVVGSADISPLFTAGINDGVNELDTYAIKPGWGFFYFSNDFDRPSPLTTNPPKPKESSSDYYVIQYGPSVFIYETANSIWDGNSIVFSKGHPSIKLGDDTTDDDAEIKPVYYYASGALRVADSNFSNIDDDDVANYKNKWFGHIKRKLFNETSDDDMTILHNRWYVDNQELIPPTAQDSAGADSGYSYIDTEGSTIAGLVDFDGNGTTVAAPSDNECMKIWVDFADDPDSTWEAGKTLTFYVSFIYDDAQESKATKLDGTGTGQTANHASTLQSLYIGVNIQYTSSGSGGFSSSTDASIKINPRITGARLYYTDPDDGDGTKYHILDIDFIKGCKKVDDTSYTDWDSIGTNQYKEYECPDGINGSAIAATTTGFKFQDPPKAITYDILNGYSSDETTSAKYKCAAIFNNRTYIGNIKQDDIVYSDRIIRSPINFEGKPQHDTFPATHKMDVASNDGDDIISLEGYADRLFVFKERSIYIINVGQDGSEFVEKHIPGTGISSPCQATLTEFGVVWINPSGCFLYSEGQPINLIDQKLTIGDTGTFSQGWNIQDSSAPAITYIRSKKQLLIAVGLKSNFSNDNWIYDFKTKGWSYSGGTLGNWQKIRSNFVMNNSGVPMFLQYDNTADAELYVPYQFEDISKDNSEFRLVTPDMTFGQPGIRKKIYKVYIAFRSSVVDTNVKVTYGVNGNPDAGETFTGTQNFTSNELQATLNSQAWVWDGSSSPTGTGGVGLAAGVSIDSTNKVLKLENIGAGPDYAYFSLGTLAVKAYKFKLYFTSGVGPSRVHDKMQQWDGMVKIGYGNVDPDSATIVETRTLSSSGSVSIEFTGTAATYYVWIYCASDDDGAFTYWQNMELLAHPEYSLAILKPATSSTANNVYSFQLKLEANGVVPAAFELADISIIYRMKNVR